MPALDQIFPFEVKAFHFGHSCWGGRAEKSTRAYGIEDVPGVPTPSGIGFFPAGREGFQSRASHFALHAGAADGKP
jgi:N-acetyl-anhydromuramyl-L-alanine amidase AmpD